MATNLTFKYHREADILRIDKRVPCAQQESEELGDDGDRSAQSAHRQGQISPFRAPEHAMS
jgi:hypothetical protein